MKKGGADTKALEIPMTKRSKIITIPRAMTSIVKGENTAAEGNKKNHNDPASRESNLTKARLLARRESKNKFDSGADSIILSCSSGNLTKPTLENLSSDVIKLRTEAFREREREREREGGG